MMEGKRPRPELSLPQLSLLNEDGQEQELFEDENIPGRLIQYRFTLEDKNPRQNCARKKVVLEKLFAGKITTCRLLICLLLKPGFNGFQSLLCSINK